MPRLSQVPPAEVTSPRVLKTYRKYFGDRNPVAEPGTSSGTPGNWWTVLALDEDLFELTLDRHAWQFSADRHLPSELRELALVRTGWMAESSFVYSQHCKVLRRLGMTENRIAAITSWTTEPVWSDTERTVLAYTDALVRSGGRVADGTFSALQRHLSDLQILELTHLICTYVMSATICRALKLEFDDRPDPILEFPAPTPTAINS